MEESGIRLLDARAKDELRAARAHILKHLKQLEGLYPTLEPRNALLFPRVCSILKTLVLDDASCAVADWPR